jgi:hypothetical protein
MEYNIGDMFVDIRDTKGTRSFIVIDIDKWDKETYYTLYITPDNKEDVFSSKMLKMFIDRYIYIHYPVVK